MRIEGLPGGDVQLTYCTNIHAGESWAQISASLDAHVPAIKAAACPNAPFGLGLRLSGEAAAELNEPHTLERFREQLAGLGAYVFTINAFPYGPFHGIRVKEQVYEPDWRRRERIAFTADAARILAGLLPDGGYGTVSTVPGGFGALRGDDDGLDGVVDGLIWAVADLVRLERGTGRRVVLALEPEPCCLVETTAEAIAFVERHLLAPAALARLAARTGLAPARAEEAMRRHLGICYDVCHGAVEFEEPVAAIRRLREAGIAVAKIQLSCALRVPTMTAEGAVGLERFDDGIYLHQVVVRNGGLTRFADLPDALSAYRAGSARGEWRVHCHVPIFQEAFGPLASTRPALLGVLAALRVEALSPHLEVETYTWDVLPEAARAGTRAQSIAREIGFVREELLA